MTQPKRVLIIDDEKPFSDSITLILETEGYETIQVYAGTKALEVVREKTPNLIILDLLIPGKSSTEIYKGLRENSQTSSIPIIFVSGKQEREARSLLGEAMKESRVRFIQKPFDPSELIGLIKSLLMDKSHSSSQLS